MSTIHKIPKTPKILPKTLSMADNHDQNSSSPNEALFFVLPYLPLYELLAMSLVCKSLRHAIATDPLPWLEIFVGRPLNLHISDNTLAAVASRARGKLQVLALINCVRITDDGLLRVVAQNPSICKLHVPGCTGLSPAGIITAVKRLTYDNHRLNTLRINGIHNIQKEDIDTLHNLLNQTQHENKKKILYHKYKGSSTLQCIDTARAIDVDTCPKCNQVRMVFDCPKLPCPKKEVTECCRGCELCITRCVECSVCITAMEEPEEAACEDILCSECWLCLSKCSFCNKPYCSQHTGRWENLPGASGFLCASCHDKFT